MTGRGRRAKSVGWNVADQVLSSVTNAALTIVVARTVSRTAFSGFALAITFYILVILVLRSICGQPLLLARAAATTRRARRRVLEDSSGLGLAFGIAASLLGLAIAAVTRGAVRAALFPLALLLVPLVVQDVCRFVAFATGRPQRAFVNDLIWVVGQLVTMAAVLATGHRTVGALVWAWAVAGSVAGVVALVMTGVRPRVLGGLRFFWRNRVLCSRFLGEVVIASGALQLSFIAIAAIRGPLVVGSLRAAPVLFGPLSLLFSASRSGLLAEMAVLAHESQSRLRRASALLSLGGALTTIVYGLAVIVIPQSVGRALLGETWRATHPLLLPFAIQYAAIGASEGAIVGLRALASARRSLAVSIRFMIMLVVLGIGGAAVAGAEGAAWGMAIASCAAIPDWYLQYRRALSEGVQALDNVRLPSPNPLARLSFTRLRQRGQQTP